MESLPAHRRRLAFLLACELVGALCFAVDQRWLAVSGSYVLVLLTLAVAARTARAEPEERLVLAGFRGVATLTVVVCAFGIVLGAWPGAGALTRLALPYCTIAAILAYRTLVADGPRRAFTSALVVLLASIPLAPFVGIAWHDADNGWHDVVAIVTVGILPVLALGTLAVALVAFVPRASLPEAVARVPQTR